MTGCVLGEKHTHVGRDKLEGTGTTRAPCSKGLIDVTQHVRVKGVVYFFVSVSRSVTLVVQNYGSLQESMLLFRTL